MTARRLSAIATILFIVGSPFQAAIFFGWQPIRVNQWLAVAIDVTAQAAITLFVTAIILATLDAIRAHGGK